MQTSKALLISCVMSLSLSGCALFGHSTAETTVNLQSVNYLNPDINGRASPLVVTVYQLKTPFNFKQATLDQLMNNSGQALGSSLIDKQTVIIKPHSQKQIQFPLADQTKYIGVIAAYRNISQANWHEVIKITPKKDNVVNINLESQGLNLSTHKTGFSL